MADRLAEYAGMDSGEENSRSAGTRRRIAWALGLSAAVIAAALAFGAYRQPELLLNLMGLRYCG